MDTHGHEEVAKAAGLPLLEDIFEPRMGSPRLEAFYMGNWLTDVSQVIDPKIGPKVKQKGHDYVDNIMRWLLNSSWMANGSRFKQFSDWVRLEPALGEISLEAHETIDAFIDWVLAPVAAGQPSRWFMLAQAGLLLKGYFKFVHPEAAADPPKMDLHSYIEVFDAQFTQYYPHEHLDRPEKSNPVPAPLTAETQYADDIASGPSTVAAPQTPDLYRYLRDDMEYIAGLLTEIDQTWARTYLTPGGTVPRDDDVDWNRGLARLGHAVHAMEDFFAHSNFIEHAATVMGGRFLPAFYQPYSSRFLKRLKRYNYLGDPDDWRTAPDESHVVTGYFDFIDTLNSLAHIATDNLLGVLDLESRDATEDLRFFVDIQVGLQDPAEVIERQANKYYRDLMELFEDPSKLLEDDADNLVAQAVQAFLEEIDNTVGESAFQKMNKFINLMSQGGVDQATMTKLVKRMPLFKEILDLQTPAGPFDAADVARVLRAFYDMTLLFRQTVAGVSFTISYYKLLSSLCEMVAAPTVWLIDKLGERVEELPIEYAKQVGVYISKELFLYSWGSMRLGCHSLLSKDHKVHEELRYQEMSDCAKLVHHAIVKTMLRWAEPNYDARPDDQKWVNWLFLLEDYLIHPRFGVACNTEQEVLTDVIHVPTENERKLGFDGVLDSLILQYQPIGLPPGNDAANREKVLEANITWVKQRKRIREIALRSVYQGAAAVIFPLRPLAGIVVPFLPLTVKTCDPTQGPQKWYMPVMENGWKQQRANHPARLIYHPSRAAANQALATLKAKRIALENSYNR